MDILAALMALIAFRVVLATHPYIRLRDYGLHGNTVLLWVSFVIIAGVPAYLVALLYLRHIKTNGPSKENFLPVDPEGITGMIVIFFASQFLIGMGSALLGLGVEVLLFPGLTENITLFSQVLDFVFTPLTMAFLIIFPDSALVLFMLVTLVYSGHIRIGGFDALTVMKGLAIGLITYLIFLPLDLYTARAYPSSVMFVSLSTTQPWVVLFFAVGACVFAPLYEEMFFRAYMFSVLSRNRGRIAAYAVSTLFFAAAHGNPFGFLSIILAGLILAWCYEKGGMWLSVGVHAGYNLLGIVALLLLF